MAETAASPVLTGWRIALFTLLGAGMFGVVVFWPAGRLDWPRGLIYMTLLAVNIAANLVYLGRVNPAVIEARTRMGPNVKRWDVVWSILFGPLFLGIYIVAGLDAARFGWSTMTPWLWLPGFVVFAVGTTLFTWAMGVNPFFEKLVRIQSERGHRVIDSGPYRFVRHPGYVGFVGWCVSAPLLLGSWWAFIPAALSVAAIVVRTALEDRTLKTGLPGYEAYATRVRYRLLPGVW